MKKSLRQLQGSLTGRFTKLLIFNGLIVILSFVALYVLFAKTVPEAQGAFFVVATLVLSVNGFLSWSLMRAFRNLICTDALTGLTNRRYLHDRLEAYEREIESLPGKRLGVLVIDVDDFRKLSDYYGHDISDKAIQRLATVIEQQLSEKDTAARLGEDVLTVLTVVDDQQTSQLVAQRICESVRSTAFECDEHPFNLTVSIGVADALDLSCIQAAFAQAEVNLREAKIAGKNQVVA